MKNTYFKLCFLLITFMVVQNTSAQDSLIEEFVYPLYLINSKVKDKTSYSHTRSGTTPGKSIGDILYKKRNDSSNIASSLNSSEVLALVGLNNKYGFIDKSGREVIPVKYESIGQNFYDGLVAVRLHGKWGHVDKNGKVVVPIEYDFVEDFHNERALVMRDNKFGFVDRKGFEVIPVKYDGAGSFHEGLAMVDLNGKKGFIDSSGKEVIPIKYDFVFDFIKEGLVEK